MEYFEKALTKKASNVIQLQDKSAEADPRAKNRQLIRGNYEFKFGSTTVTHQQKLKLVGGEPTAYHLYKRRDLETKIDKLAVDRLRMAKMVFNVTQQARKDRSEYLRLK